MSRNAAIREWIKQQGRPCSPAEIAQALGCAEGKDGAKDRQRIYWSISLMFREGVLARTGSGNRMRYTVQREPVVKPLLTAEERRERRNARARAAHVSAGGRSWAELAAERRRRADERAADRQRKRAAREAARDAARKARKEADAKRQAVEQARARTRAKAAPHRVSAPARVAAAVPPAERPESVAKWMARTGKTPQVLPIGAVSQPLKRIGKPGAFTITRKKAA